MSLRRQQDHDVVPAGPRIGRLRICLGVALVALLASLPMAGWADDEERIAMARVRLTTEAQTIPPTCTFLGAVRDDSVKDLRRKIVRAGGDTGLLSFAVDDLSIIYAKVYRCPVSPPIPPPPPPPPSR